LLAAIRFALRYRRWGVIRCFFQAGYLADVLRRDPVSHLHAHFATAPALVAMFTHELIGVPYTFTAHARDIYVDTQPALLRAQMARARAVVTVCEYNRRYLAGHLGPESQGKVRCVYNGLDLRPFTGAPPATTDTDTGPPLILSVGRLIEKKGIGDVIAAADILRERGRSFQVEIIGTGPLGPSVAADVKRRGLEDRVQLRGAQPLDVIRLAYRRATVFALPSVVAADGDRDGVPTVLMEAMASGVAVVSTCVSGIPELITAGQDGLLVAPRCPAALADALDVLLSDPELRARLARAARRKIEECFAIDRSAAHLLALFQQGGDG
jgi:glycosyltransferase involved in cell wall biosynthesis